MELLSNAMENAPPINLESNKDIVPVSKLVNITNNSNNNNTESHNEDTFTSNCTITSVNDNQISINNVIISTFRSENLQQLSTNALPPYVPDSPPSFIRPDIKAFDIHSCTDCGDTFALKSSLNFHLERRSVLIKFPCDSCKSTRIFYNRCNLLAHIRAHDNENVKDNISKAVVTVLPRVFMDGIQSEFVNTLDDELNSIDDRENLPASEMFECSLQEVDEPLNINHRSEIGKKDSNIIKVKCLDCNEEFDSAFERKEHLMNGDKIPLPMPQCEKCGIVCPSKCSLKAHQRIHLQISPYVCPECGESPDPHWAQFLNHVNFQCFHNARAIGYKCPVCKRVVASHDLLIKHMELHTEKYAKCAECPRAYNSTQAFKAHNNVYHSGMAVGFTMIYKCSLCDIVFVSNDQMLNHRPTHLKEQVCEFVFNCMQCGKGVDTKTQLQTHIRVTHPKIYKQAFQNDVSNSKPVVPLTTVAYRGNVECILCNSIFYSQQGYNVHLGRAHIRINQECEVCNKQLPFRKAMVKHGKLHLQEKVFVCLLCNNWKFNTAEELDAHLDNHAKKLKFCSFCPFCYNIMPTLSEALNHLREEHFLPLKTSNKNSSPYKQNTSSSCHFCRELFASADELQEHLKNEHSVNQTSQIEETVQTSESPFKKQKTSGNSCAKCQYQSEVREDFKKHIASHKTNSATFQCQECGQCFIVQASLSKHLKIVHKISDPKKYMHDEGTNYVPEKEDPAEVSRSALECSVCFTQFPNETALNKHMRSHGMAFIQANKSGLL